MARPEAAHGNGGFRSFCLPSSPLAFGVADPRHLPDGVGHAGNHQSRRRRPCGRWRLPPQRAPHAPPFVRQHRLADDDIADGEDVRHVGAHLRIDVDEAAVGDDDARLLGADLLAVGARPRTAGSGRNVRPHRGRLHPSNLTRMPSSVASWQTVLVFSDALEAMGVLLPTPHGASGPGPASGRPSSRRRQPWRPASE